MRSDTIYAVTHEEGLLKSTDAGATWSPLAVLTDTLLLDIRISHQDPSTIFIAAVTGLYRYAVGPPGNLTKIGDGLAEFPRAIAVRPDNPNIVFVTAGKSGVFKSNDGGITFTPANVNLDPVIVEPRLAATYLAMSPVNPDFLFVSFLELGDNQPYYSHDGGETWQRPAELDVGNLISQVNNSFGGEFLSTPIAPSPVDENIAIASGNGNHVEVTVDGGANWTYSGNGYTGGRAGTTSTSFGWDMNDPNRFAMFLIDYGVVLTEDGGEIFET